MARVVEVPDAVRVTATAAGAPGARWLASLGGLLDELEAAWDLALGDTMPGGTAGLVVEATQSDGAPAVVKLTMPDPSAGRSATADEVQVLRLADGRGCVRLLAHDADREALLLERLGRQVHELGWPVQRQIAVICAALRELWTVDATDAALPTLQEKGRWLAEFITTTDDALGNPCSRRAIDRALEYAERRVAQCDPGRAVLLHGDAHAWNTLEDSAAGDGAFRLVDADGLVGEPEYDLAISMREFTDELMAGDAVRIGRDRARFLAHHTGLDEVRIWEWGYIERVSTGLLCVAEGHAPGRDFLTIAEAWSGAPT